MIPPTLARLASLALPAALAAGCATYTARIEAPRFVALGAPVDATARTDCRPGANGCPGGDRQIREFEVSPSDAVTAVERRGETLRFTPTRPATLRVTLDVLIDGDPQNVEAIVVARRAEGAVIDGCPERPALVAGFRGTARIHLTAGGERLSTPAKAFESSPGAIIQRVGPTYILDGRSVRPGARVELTSPQLPGWSRSFAVVDKADIDAVRLARETVAVGDRAEVGLAFSAGGHAICPSLELRSAVEVETPETCAVDHAGLRGRAVAHVRGLAAGACRLRFTIGHRPVATLRIR